MFYQLEILSDEQNEKLKEIRNFIKNLNSVCVAYSGGVDSTLVASLAFEQLGSKAIAITGVSPALAKTCLLYTSPSPRDGLLSRMPSSA